MSDMEIKIQNLKPLIEKLDAPTKKEVFTRSLRQGSLELARWSQVRRLSGPRPRFLGVKTGRLRSSIYTSPTQVIGNNYISRYGTNVKYGRVHEYGFDGTVGVRSHLRKTKGRHAFVKTHSRKMNIKAKPFLRPAIESKRNINLVLEIITEHIYNALERAK